MGYEPIKELENAEGENITEEGPAQDIIPPFWAEGQF